MGHRDDLAFMALDDSDEATGDVSDREQNDIIYSAAIPFVMVHLACIAAIWTGITWQAVAICNALGECSDRVL